MALHAEADAGAMHEDVEDLVEGLNGIDGEIGAVVCGDAAPSQRGAGRHERTHGRHDVELAHRGLEVPPLRRRNPVAVVVPQVLLHVVKVPARPEEECRGEGDVRTTSGPE